MPVTSYISVGGRMISEVTDGVILDYVPDALGSVHSVIDQDHNVVKTMRYKPYGEVLSRSGTVADRHYQWVGSYGYRATFAPSSSHYVRARHYSATAGSWSTVDPLWPDESAYGYVRGRPVTWMDPFGEKAVGFGCAPEVLKGFSKECEKLAKCLSSKKCTQRLLDCASKKGIPKNFAEQVLKRVAAACLEPVDRTCVFCPAPGKLPGVCEEFCEDAWAVTVEPVPNPIPIPPGLEDKPGEKCRGIKRDPRNPWDLCLKTLLLGENESSKSCKCSVLICDPKAPTDTLVHELMHCMGIGGGSEHAEGNDVIGKLMDCFNGVK